MESLSSNIRFGVHLMTMPVSSHVTAGLCKIAGFECLSHSTDLSSLFSILKRGASPQIALKNALKQREAKFFVLKDSETNFFEKIYFSRYYARDHGYLLGHDLAKYFAKDKKIHKWAAIFFSFFHLVYSPTVYFIYRREEIEKGDLFQDDQIAQIVQRNRVAMTEKEKLYWEDMGRKALETEKPLPNHRIGLVGIITHISMKGVLHSVYDNPLRVIQGIAQVAIGYYLTVSSLGLIT